MLPGGESGCLQHTSPVGFLRMETDIWVVSASVGAGGGTPMLLGAVTALCAAAVHPHAFMSLSVNWRMLWAALCGVSMLLFLAWQRLFAALQSFELV